MSPGWLAGVAFWLAAYELGRARCVARGRRWPGWRRGCWWAAAGLLVAIWLLSPTAEGARLLWAETLQFGIAAFGVAPLAVLAAPTGLRAHEPRRRRSRLSRAWRVRGWLAGALALFLAATIAWRLPTTVDAVVEHPGLVALEAATLVAGTWLFWVAVAATPPRPLFDHRPSRIALAATAAWSVWIFAYAVGFSGHPFYPSYSTGSNPVTAQEWAVCVLFLTSAAAILPTAFVNLMRWLAADRLVADAETDLYLQGSERPGGRRADDEA